MVAMHANRGDRPDLGPRGRVAARPSVQLRGSGSNAGAGGTGGNARPYHTPSP